MEASQLPDPFASIPRLSSDELVEEPVDRALERALVARAQEGDREAFEQLYRGHLPGVARRVRYRLGAADEDVVADVFVQAWRSLPQYRDTGAAFGAWLDGIAKHVVANEFRKRGRTVPMAEPPDRSVEPMTAELVALRVAVESLPSEQRRVIELKYLVGLTNDEVARIMGTTSRGVNARQYRALRALARLLEERP